MAPHGPPADQLRAISQVTHSLVAEQYRVLNDDLLPALAAFLTYLVMIALLLWRPDGLFARSR